MTPNVSIALLRTQTDARLTALAAAGHDRAFEAIVDRYRRPLLRYARGFSLDAGAAEDVVQASCVAAWAALRDGAAVQDLRPWLYRIVHNRSINAARAARGNLPLVEALDERPGPQAGLESREEVRQTLDGIAALPERQRAALVAVAIDGRAHVDVGEQLGVSDMAVRKLVSRARGSLRTAATAITPMPVAAWLAQATGGAGDQAARIAEIVAVGGSAGLAGGSVLKAGAVAITIGAVAAGAPQISDHARQSERPAVARAAPTAGAKLSAPTTAVVSRPGSRDEGDAAGFVGDGSGPGSGDDENSQGAGDERGKGPGSKDDGGRREGQESSGPSRRDGSEDEDDSAVPGDERRPHRGSGRSGTEPDESKDSSIGSGDDLPGLHEDDQPATMSDDTPGSGTDEPRRDEPGNSGSGSAGSDSSGPQSGPSSELEPPEPSEPPEHAAP